MLVDFNYKFTNLDGREIAGPDGKSTTLAMISASVLTGEVGKSRESIGASESIRRYQLAVKIHGAVEPLELPAEDVALLKKLIADNFIPIIVAPALKVLDPLEK